VIRKKVPQLLVNVFVKEDLRRGRIIRAKPARLHRNVISARYRSAVHHFGVTCNTQPGGVSRSNRAFPITRARQPADLQTLGSISNLLRSANEWYLLSITTCIDLMGASPLLSALSSARHFLNLIRDIERRLKTMHSDGIAADQHQIRTMRPWESEPEAGLDWERSDVDSVSGVSRLRKLPPSPFRSLGGYLDYAEWPDCERFMELDRAIQSTPESQLTAGGADSCDSQGSRAEWYSGRLKYADRFRKSSFSAIPYAASAEMEHCAEGFPAYAIGRLEEMPIRRL
jgi:hypothetical protein